MDFPLISIITVTLNSEKYLEQCILSVLNQTYRNIEYIIIDGGSTDNTLSIIKKYADKLSYWISEKDVGIYDAMNKGIAKSSGNFIGIINSDDFYETTAIENIVSTINSNHFPDVIYGNLSKIDSLTGTSVIRLGRKDLSLVSFKIWHPTVFIRKECYQRNGTYLLDFPIAADYELLLRFFTNNLRFIYTDSLIANFREGGASQFSFSLIFEIFRIDILYFSKFNAFVKLCKNLIKKLIQSSAQKLLSIEKYNLVRRKIYQQ